MSALRKWAGRIRRSPTVFRETLRARQQLQQLGHPPGHYYSPIPPFDEILSDPAWGADETLAGIDLNEHGQLELLDKLAALQADLPADPTPGRRYYSNNDFYAAADGTILQAMLRHLQPARVIEIGSGFSSALMLDTSETFLGGRTRFTFIDPEPERLLSLLNADDRATVFSRSMQEVPQDVFAELAAGDILFIDSSHVTKAGSDVNRIYFEVLPRLAPGVYVHIHDIFYPFEYPRGYLERRWAWNEGYLLRAFLMFNSSFEVALFPSFLETHHADRLAAALPLAMSHPPNWPSLRGANIWLRRAGA